MPAPSEKRVTLSVNLTPTAREVIEQLRVDTGIPNTTATERLFEWFARMPRKFRVALLTGDVDGQHELLIAWFKETMAAHGKQVDVTEGDYVNARAKLAKDLIDELTIAYAVERKKNNDRPKRKN